MFQTEYSSVDSVLDELGNLIRMHVRNLRVSIGVGLDLMELELEIDV